MSFIEALKQAMALALHGKLAEAEAVLHEYFHPGGGVQTADSGDNSPPPKP